MNNILTDQIEQWDRPLLNVVSQKVMSKHLKQLEKLCTNLSKKRDNGSAVWQDAGLLPTKPQTKYKF